MWGKVLVQCTNVERNTYVISRGKFLASHYGNTSKRTMEVSVTGISLR